MSGPDDLWRRADDAFDRALDLPAAERASFLAELDASDPELRTEVERLLRAHDRSEGFLAEPAPVFGAALLPDLPPAMPELRAGTRVGSYAILERIGSGGMGVVYKAHDERLDRFVALKFLTADLDADEDARSRFLTEARIASALDHPGIAVVHEIAETDDHHVFVAMAFYEGETLKDRLRDGPLPLDTCVDFAIQIAEALGAAHRHGIVHRDIKPANVIVTDHGVAKIVDFGIARIVAAESGGERAGESARGSPGYMSPEQRTGGEVDARADVWSFGVLLHEMLTGRRPRDDFVPSPLPAALQPVLARCLERDPEKRYADASELLADLRTAASDVRGERARRRWPAVAAVVGAVALAAAAALMMFERSTARLPAGTAQHQDSLPAMDVTTSSMVAYRFYQEGLGSYATGEYHNAVRLFDAALAEDPAFAMAAHYGWLARSLLDQPLPAGALDDLLRLAERASEAERREIRDAWLFSAGALDSSAIAGTPPEPASTDQQGHYARGLARVLRGDALGALPDLRRAVALSSERDERSGRCRACDAFAALSSAYVAVDSLDAAERVTREWIRLQPGSARAWRNLVVIELGRQRYDEVAVANRRVIEISPGRAGDAMVPAESRIRQAEFEIADRLLQDLARDGTTMERADAAWFQTISFRYQGRLGEALEAAGRFAAAVPTDVGARLHRAQVLLETGRAAEAAALFDSSASLARSVAPAGVAARQEAWSLTHRATALAALGDTSSLAGLADAIESAGRRSYYGRDLILHHHVRGLLLAARGDLEAAAAAFRRAVYTPTLGYTRTNVELARVLIELGRPLEAVAILGPALRGPLEASNLYATHTEIHELLGRAWHAAGRADSAAVHDAWVLKAWQDADPAFAARRDAVRRRAGAGRR